MRSADTYHPTPLTSGISAFLDWVMVWYFYWAERYVDYEVEYEYYYERPDYTMNRHRRRFAHKELPATRYTTLYLCIFARDLSPNQFIERAARLSVKGRRRYYGTLRHTRSRGAQRAGVRMFSPRNTLSALGCASEGLWDAHLWPG